MPNETKRMEYNLKYAIISSAKKREEINKAKATLNVVMNKIQCAKTLEEKKTITNKNFSKESLEFASDQSDISDRMNALTVAICSANVEAVQILLQYIDNLHYYYFHI